MSPISTAFAEELIAYWLSFVRSGNPNTYRLTRSPTWSRYAKANRMRMVLQEDPAQIVSRSGSVLEVESEEEAGRCALVGTLAVEMEN
jgi:carboxylesterase type B